MFSLSGLIRVVPAWRTQGAPAREQRPAEVFLQTSNSPVSVLSLSFPGAHLSLQRPHLAFLRPPHCDWKETGVEGGGQRTRALAASPLGAQRKHVGGKLLGTERRQADPWG